MYSKASVVGPNRWARSSVLTGSYKGNKSCSAIPQRSLNNQGAKLITSPRGIRSHEDQRFHPTCKLTRYPHILGWVPADDVKLLGWRWRIGFTHNNSMSQVISIFAQISWTFIPIGQYRGPGTPVHAVGCVIGEEPWASGNQSFYTESEYAFCRGRHHLYHPRLEANLPFVLEEDTILSLGSVHCINIPEKTVRNKSSECLCL